MRILALLFGLLALPAGGLVLAVLVVCGLRFHVERARVVGRRGRVFIRRRLVFSEGRLGNIAKRMGLGSIADALLLIGGQLALIGPRPWSATEPDAFDVARTSVRPGVLSPYDLRRWGNCAYESELSVDIDYASRRSTLGDLGLLVRAFFVRAMSPSRPSTLARLDIDGIGVDNLTLDETLDRIQFHLGGSEPRTVSFVNADCINIAARQPEYRRALRFADLVLGDGAGVRIFSRLIGEPLRENVNGTDLFPRLCERLSGTDDSVYLLGGRPGIAAAVADWIKTHHPSCRVAGHHDGYFTNAQQAEVIADIHRSGATLLLVAFGAPRQELWLREHLRETGARVGIGVGGLFDFYSGRIPRAPMWMREAGLEWIYRFSREPRRLWRRYGPGNVEFLTRALAAAWQKRRLRSGFRVRNAH